MVMMMTQMNSFARLRPVQSIKHVVDIQGGLVAGAQSNFALVDTVDAPVLANPADVMTGTTVHSIFLNVQVAATATPSLANIYMAIMKNPGDNLPVPSPQTIGTSDEKKQIIHQEMIMTEKNSTAIPRTLFKGVIKIPRGYKRFGHDDKLLILLLAPGVSYEFCIQCIYKEYR